MTFRHHEEALHAYVLNGAQHQNQKAIRAAMVAASAEAREQDNHLSKTVPKLKPHEISAIDQYTGSDYRELNDALNHHNPEPWFDEDMEHTHKSLQSAISRNGPADHEMHVYAGMPGSNLHYNLKEGGHFIMKGYTSTSIHPNIAHGFAKDHEEANNPEPEPDEGSDENDPTYTSEHHIAHFIIPKGHKGWLYVAGHSQHPEEKEVLLPPNTRARHMGTKRFEGPRFGNNRNVSVVHSFLLKPNEKINDPQGNLFDD